MCNEIYISRKIAILNTGLHGVHRVLNNTFVRGTDDPSSLLSLWLNWMYNVMGALHGCHTVKFDV